jgi:fumarate reductase subunit C
MKHASVYTEYHPRWYRPRVSTYWWLERWSSLKFILRELSSVCVAWFAVVLMLLLRALRGGPGAYQGFLEWLQSPALVVINVISLAFVVFHAVTWFNLAPKALVVRLGGKRVPGWMIAGGNYAAWLVVSVALGWLVLRG